MIKTILVNKQNPIKESFYKKIDLIDIVTEDNTETKIEKETYQSYLELKKYLEEKNIYIEIDSAYRSIKHQQELYNEFCDKYGKEYANSVVAEPTKSEHHTGLAIDLSIRNEFGYIEEDNYELYHKTYNEIHNIIAKFGFILRYPKGKEHITGYPYEPWHIRYVGKFVAKIISENNYTLEEYLNEFSAVILVNKEQNMTSFDVVNEISHLFGIKKVGHTGTLDPLAEGVLIVAIGQATKVVELLTATYKEYIAKVKLGILTDTLDITGNLIKEEEIPENLDIEKVIRNFKKTYMQEVPIYSAVKVNGKKLYEYARNNEKVTLPTKEVTIKEIELLSKTSDTFEFKTTVSKGCYIRSLINDIAQELNTIGVMSELTRTKQGNISLEQTSTLQEIKQGKYKIYDIDQVLEIPVIKLNDFLSKKVKSGHKLNNTWNIKNKGIFKDENNKILGIYENNDNILKTWKNFV